ncbi:MAG: DUF6094 domain-containing protein [Azonexus sp.]|jgi:tRNA1(Val) A37 N6-methylase TrmN6|nr:DUF6094 domain-containing protein [Azonexus sp.]
MALMFSRLARNFIKNGYFPTDEDTVGCITHLLCAQRSPARLFDPCCGEGTALADIEQGLRDQARLDHPDGDPPQLETLGVELDSERAWHAKTILDRVIHSDLNDVVVKARSIGLMFLNPPYGYGVKDGANVSSAELDHAKAERLERTFLRMATPLIAYGGILVYIIPFYALDDDIRAHLARNYDRVRVFMAPEQRFKQCVVVGVRRRSANASKAVLDMLVQAKEKPELTPVLPESWEDEPYQIPAIEPGQEFTFHAVRIDAPQLGDELRRLNNSLLWPSLEVHFNQVKAACRPPLREMTPWHLALSLAAGQIQGRIHSVEGREFLIKGDTFKTKQRTVNSEVNDQGEVSQTIVLLDKFVPVINAIELTAGQRRGQIIKIA